MLWDLRTGSKSHTKDDYAFDVTTEKEASERFHNTSSPDMTTSQM